MKTVRVYRLLAEGTCEEQIYKRQISKAAVIGDAASICEAITAKKQQACAKAMGVPAAGAGCVGSPITAGGARA